ncbi:MAG: AAA family ATPase [Dongiaceae bacterium]
MSVDRLAADEVGLPRFAAGEAAPCEVFALGSHARAREALDFGLAVSGLGFNVFVIGDDRSGRMTATLAHLESAVAGRPPASDWIYLNNFRRPHRPTAHRLPAGAGRRFRERLAAVVAQLRGALSAAFPSDAYQAAVAARHRAAQQGVASELDALGAEARASGLELRRDEGGRLELVPLPPAEGAAGPDAGPRRDPAAILGRFPLHRATAQAQLAERIAALDRVIAIEVASPLLEGLLAEFSGFGGLARWLTELRVDILEAPGRFRPPPEGEAGALQDPESRYAVNLLVDHGESRRPPVLLESSPSYENLFGRITYRQLRGSLETDFTLIRPGALHLANGGILVLRAEALAADPPLWSFLKAALRDQEIRIEERRRAEGPAIDGAPQPDPIPLDLKVVLVGAPVWYARFFEGDPDFATYFKIKAEIDPDMPASPANRAILAGLIERVAAERGLAGIEPAATARLLGEAARLAQRRDRLSARYEVIQDLVAEAATVARLARQPRLTEAALIAALAAWRRRRAAAEEHAVRDIAEGTVMIDTAGAAVGQVNGLTVLEAGDWRFGAPVRITARGSVGRRGIVNIERDVALGGPVQQKGAMVFQGFLARRFARDRPLSFTCSITFEQTYGAVEGDSASLAELVAVLSDLAELPVRQDLAVTGSVNQMGRVQAIGGATWKVEGFHRVCAARPGGLGGRQGVVLPAANRVNLVLADEVAAAVAAGRFHLWPVETVEEALGLLLGVEAGVADGAGRYPADSVYGRVAARLDGFDRLLARRHEDDVPARD